MRYSKLPEVTVLQERGPLPVRKTGLLSNTQKWTVWGDTSADKARDFTGKRHLVENSREPMRTALSHGLQSRGFMVMGLVSGLSLASESFLVHTLFSQDGFQREGFWEVVRHVVSPFDLSWTLPVGGGLLSSLFLTRISCRKTAHANGYCGGWPRWADPVSVLPLTTGLTGSRIQKQMPTPGSQQPKNCSEQYGRRTWGPEWLCHGNALRPHTLTSRPSFFPWEPKANHIYSQYWWGGASPKTKGLAPSPLTHFRANPTLSPSGPRVPFPYPDSTLDLRYLERPWDGGRKKTSRKQQIGAVKPSSWFQSS